jgi:rhamnosyl/mannosyltransferase
LKYKSRKFKLFVYWHLDITKQRFLRTFFKGQNRQLIERADKILGATPIHLKESAYSEYFGTKAYLLPYMINIGKLQISDRDRKFAEKIRDTYPNKVIGFFIGRHVPYKGLQYLLEASREVKSDNLQILIAGRGEETNKLMKYAEGDNKVRFLGVIDDAAKRAYLKACDIICFPSVTRSEAFGIALAEGMYFGKPAITFTIPGSGENYVNLNGVTGIECSCRDSRAYAEALDLLAQNKELRSAYGINAHKRIVDNFTEEQFVENIKQLIV